SGMHREEVLKALQDDFNIIIKNHEQLQDVLLFLNDTEKKIILDAVSDDLKKAPSEVVEQQPSEVKEREEPSDVDEVRTNPMLEKKSQDTKETPIDEAPSKETSKSKKSIFMSFKKKSQKQLGFKVVDNKQDVADKDVAEKDITHKKNMP
ncbi:MAG: hypothetical protein QNK11_05595, partial [Legionella sp.]|nr:hypothetical protein [Legionella sp.]